MVRTEAGKTRRVRAVDLERVAAPAPERPAAERPAAPATAATASAAGAAPAEG
jgi:hypothetical protein